MKKCNSCFYQEKNYNGDLICQHIQSVGGFEAYEEYKMCDEIASCKLYRKSNYECSDCKVDCYEAQSKMKCPKI